MEMHLDSSLFDGEEGYERFKAILVDIVKDSQGNPIPLVHAGNVVCYLFEPNSPLLN